MSGTITRNDLIESRIAGRSRARLNLYLLGFAVYWYSPVIYGYWLWRNLKMGAFAVDSDSISIPLMAFAVLWFVGFPFFVFATIAFESLMRQRDKRLKRRFAI